MKRQRRVRLRAVPPFGYVLVWGYALLSGYPLLWMVFQSFREDADILSDPAGLPLAPTLDGYITAFSTTPVPQYFFNSSLVTAAVIVISVTVCAAAGYAFSRQPFPGSNGLFALFILVLAIPAPVLLLPVFLIAGELGILNSYIGLIGPIAAGTLPLGVYLMKTHFDSIPHELGEAAQIDRASDWQIFVKIMVPMVGPAAAIVAVLGFMASWNAYIYPLVAIRSSELFTLPIGIADLAGKESIYGLAPVFAAMVVSAVPVYLAFMLAQRSFMTSFALGGALKG